MTFFFVLLNIPDHLVFFFFFSSEALPFFLLLIDLSRASALAKFALSSNSQVLFIRHECQLYSFFFRLLTLIGRISRVSSQSKI